MNATLQNQLTNYQQQLQNVRQTLQQKRVEVQQGEVVELQLVGAISALQALNNQLQAEAAQQEWVEENPDENTEQ